MPLTENSTLKRWRPTDAEPWDIRRVWHLHRRAGFGATWEQLQRDLRDGPETAIDRIVAGWKDDAGNSEFERMSSVICDAAVGSNNINRLKAWWLFRMLNSPSPLRERLTLLWHNHFATSNVKVQDVAMMRRQHESLRRRAGGRFADLLRAMANDPALLVWLDADANRKEHPNENLAREIMELFTLGVGNYSEQDIKEAARALTGWTVKQGEFLNVADWHDAGEKRIFDKKGKWNGDDLVNMLIEHPATPRRIAVRICELLMGESTVNDVLIDELAGGLASRALDISWAVETLLRSETFFDEANLGNRVLSPVEFTLGAIHCLEINNPLPSTLILAEVAASLGQNLFNPPNVFGWKGGRSWLTSRSIIGRANFAEDLTNGRLHATETPLDAKKLAAHYGVVGDQERIAFFYRLLLGTDAHAPRAKLSAREPKQLVRSILSSPEALLG